MLNKVASFEEGWDIIEKGIKNILEGLPAKPYFTTEEYMKIYNTIYVMCFQKPPHNYYDELYEKYQKIFEEYIKSIVLPSLRGKKNELLLRELLERWSNHKIMTKYLSHFFLSLDNKQYYAPLKPPSVKEIGFLSFYSLVYNEMNRQVMDAILAMIDQKKAGEPIDDNLVNNILTFYSELGESTRKDGPKHFVETMIKENAIEDV